MNGTVKEKKQWDKPVIKQMVLQFDKDVVASCHTNSTAPNVGNACNPGNSNDAPTKCN